MLKIKMLVLFVLMSLCSFGQVNVKNSPYNAKGDGQLFIDGSMPGTSATGSQFRCSATCYLSGFLADFSGVNTTAPIDVFGSAGGTTSTAIAPSVTTTQTNDVLITAAGLNTTFTSPTAPPTQVGYIQYNPSTSVGSYGGITSESSAGATGAVSIALSCCVGSSSYQWGALSIALAPSGTISFNTSESIAPSFGSSITFPAVTNSANDIQIACIAYWGSATITPPTGWTLITTNGVSGAHRKFVLCRRDRPHALNMIPQVRPLSQGKRRMLCPTLHVPQKEFVCPSHHRDGLRLRRSLGAI